MWMALGIVAGLGLGVAWLLHRIAWEIARFEDWDQPLITQKRRTWR